MTALGNADIGLTTFFASAHPADTCGTNGLPLTPNSVRIFGRFQALKGVQHPNLCQYIDIVRGKQERLVVVAEHYNDSLEKHLSIGDIASLPLLQKIAYETLLALRCLHQHDITHRNLSPSTILLDPYVSVKISKFGMYKVTGYGNDVAFPVGSPCYMAPDALASALGSSTILRPSLPAVDIWALGMILLDVYLLGNLWAGSRTQIQKVFHKLLQLYSNPDITDGLKEILKCSFAIDILKGMDRTFKSFIKQCLIINPTARPGAVDLLKHEFLQDLTKLQAPMLNSYCKFPPVSRSMHLILPDYNKLLAELSEVEDEDHLAGRPIKEVYYFWTLAGGDVLSELKKNGLMKTQPPCLSLPVAMLNNGEIFGQEKEQELMLDETTICLSLSKLRMKLQNIDDTAYYPLIVEDELNPVNLTETQKLPLVIREKDVVYQVHRVILFERLLDGYPYTRDRIVKEARIDIPPCVRNKVWAALLNVLGDIQQNYDNIDKESITPTDRQIEVDIPRCHQYNQLLSSPTAHNKFKRILKAWVVSHPKLSYWQGLDSLSAPFISLNFDNEALAYACLSAFIPKYLNKFFLKDNSQVIHEYLAVFSHMVAFHDPELYNHLNDIGFAPELYAIPWFLTMFSHVFPLHKIFYLWDTLMLGNSMLPSCIGVSILKQLRDQLVSFGFNECIMLFSDMPGIDIERCVRDSIKLFNHTPPSANMKRHDNPDNRNKAPEEEKFLNLPDKEFIPLEQLKMEVCPRISVRDMVRISQLMQKQDASMYSPPSKNETTGKNEHKDTRRKQVKSEKAAKTATKQTKVLVVDVRSSEEYNSGHYMNSINIPFQQAFTETGDLAPSQASIILLNHSGKMVMVTGNRGNEPAEFGARLVALNFRRVCVMDGSVGILRTAGYLNNVFI